MPISTGPLPTAQKGSIARIDFNDLKDRIENAFPLNNIDIQNHVTDIHLTRFRKFQRWYTSPKDGSIGTKVIVANNIYSIPFHVNKDESFDTIGIQVSTGSAGSARLGIYKDNGAGTPGTLQQDVGTVDVTSTGMKTKVASIPLTEGLYWLVIVSDATPSIRGIPIDSGVAPLGAPNPGDPNGTHYLAPFAFAPLPEASPSGGRTIESTVAPIVALRHV